MSKMNFDLIQFRWYRKWKGGTYYYIVNWITNPFWSDKLITSCGGRAIKIETYGGNKWANLKTKQLN